MPISFRCVSLFRLAHKMPPEYSEWQSNFLEISEYARSVAAERSRRWQIQWMSRNMKITGFRYHIDYRVDWPKNNIQSQ